MKLSNTDIAQGLVYAIDATTTYDYPRDYLGLSQAGHSCARYLWFYLHWAAKIKLKARTKRIFQAGHDSEEIIIDALKSAGIIISGRQIELSHAGGFSLGHIDGIVSNIPDCTRKAVLEAKSMKDAKWKSAVKNGVRKVYKSYYCQGQVYSHKLELDLIMFVLLNKDTSELHIEFLEYNKTDAVNLLERISYVVSSQVPPLGVSSDPDYFECSWCEFKEVCHEHKPFAVNCRTCVDVSMLPKEGKGAWVCSKSNKRLTTQAQKAACTEYSMLQV